MPFRAFLNGNPVVARRSMDEATRSSLRQASLGGALKLRCCDGRVVFKISPRGTPFFAHYERPAGCVSPPESPLHLDLKAAAIEAAEDAGWSAEPEFEPDDRSWRADVMASRGHIRIAIEIQLSKQGASQTELRDRRYHGDRIIPFWIVLPRTSVSGFDMTHAAVLRQQEDEQRLIEAKEHVRAFLAWVERYEILAKDVLEAAAMKQAHGWSHEVTHRLGELPVIVRMTREGAYQDIVIGDLGEESLPATSSALLDGAPDQHAGAIAQFVRHADPIKGFYASAFRLGKAPGATTIADKLRQLLTRKLVWCSREDSYPIGSCFVRYPETCGCGTTFLRAPYVLIGNATVPPWFRSAVEEVGFWSVETLEAWREKVNRISSVPLGDFALDWHDTGEITGQRCPGCGRFHGEVLLEKRYGTWWPGGVPEFTVPVKGPGWVVTDQNRPRRLPRQDQWDRLIADLRQAREVNVARKKFARERQADVERAAEAERRATYDADTRRMFRITRIRGAAELRFGPRHSIAWLHRRQQDLGGRTPLEACAESDELLERCLAGLDAKSWTSPV